MQTQAQHLEHRPRRARHALRTLEVLALVMAGLFLGAVGLVKAEHCPHPVQVHR